MGCYIILTYLAPTAEYYGILLLNIWRLTIILLLFK